jgi:hypothetical protein
MKWRWIGILLIAGLRFYLRCAAILETEIDHPIRADAAQYYITAYNLAKNGVYSMSFARLSDPSAVLQPDSFRWPGLPLVIASFMSAWPDHMLILREVQWVNIIAGTAAILLIGVAAAMALPAWAALAVAFLTAISPHLVSLTVYLLTETPGAFFVALLLALCAFQPMNSAERRPYLMVTLGIVIGVLALFRPIFAAFVPFLALAVSGDRLKCLALLVLGAALPLAPWFIRNMLSVVPGAAPSSLAQTLVMGAYPGYMFNGDPSTFPFPPSHDPDFNNASANVATALEEIWRRIAADPVGMMKWYFLGKPPYLWQFSNIDGVGDVFVYPIIATPFTSNPVFGLTHDAMRIMQWPIVLLAAVGSILVWLPGCAGFVAESRGLALRAGSLLLIFLTVATIPLNDPARFAVPVYPALFLMALVPLVVCVRYVRTRTSAA